MESTKTKSKTYGVKKDKQFLSLKRKLEASKYAFESEANAVPKKKRNEVGYNTLEEDFNALKSELNMYVKTPDLEPRFYLTEIGMKSQLVVTGKRKAKPIFLENIYQLMLKAVGQISSNTFDWAILDQPQNLSKTVHLVIGGLPRSLLVQNWSSLPNIAGIFPYIIDVASANLPFLQDPTHTEENYEDSTAFPSAKILNTVGEEDSTKTSKVYLLLSLMQMVLGNYPLPPSVLMSSKCHSYVFSKDKYEPVSASSPLFAVDCEMVRSQKSTELARVAVVNENLEIVYESLVKPKAKIVDYMTKYSGITKSILKDVTTSLEDVQLEMKKILPPDAILCGHSLNHDLHALKMIHPYCIDTSIIYNGSGMRAKKDSLKFLTLVHLKEKIQCSSAGHNPTEDALATMKLVQLKLDNSLQFGDICFNENILTDSIKVETNKKEIIEHKQTDDTEGFFDFISKHKKKVCLIGCEETLKLYGAVPETVKKEVKLNNKKTIKAIVNKMDSFDLTIGHLGFKETLNSICKLDETIKYLFDSCSKRTMLMVYISSIEVFNFKDIRDGIFMATVKK